MSYEDSLSDMNIAPQRLMPKAQSLTEHHRVLGMNAIHHGNTMATIKAHHVRISDVDERVEELEKLPEAIASLRSDLSSNRDAMRDYANQQERALASVGGLVAQLNDKMVRQEQGVDMRKAIVGGVFALLIAIVTAGGGYLMGHQSPGPKYEPHTAAQIQSVDQKYNDMQPENQRQINGH